ncbi:hypothetical protein ACFX15_045070 [Malus domestica]
MAAATNTPPSTDSSTLPNVSHAITLKLDTTNYPLWLAQIVPVLKSRRLMHFIDGSSECPAHFLKDDTGNLITNVNPAYEDWIQKDQLVISWFNGSLGLQTLSAIACYKSARDVWVALQHRYASHNQSRIIQFRTAFFQTKHGDSSITDYLDRIHSLADSLALAGSPITDADLVAVIMSNVGPKFKNTVDAAQARENPVSYVDLEALILSTELRLTDPSPPVDHSVQAMAASRNHNSSCGGGRSFSVRNDGRSSRGGGFYRGNSHTSGPFHHGERSGGFYRGNSNSSGNSNRGQLAAGLLGLALNPHNGSSSSTFSESHIKCQICGSLRHPAIDCYDRMNLAYEGRIPSKRLTAMVAQSVAQSAQTNKPWLLDSGANSHITNDLGKLTLTRDYRGNDTVGGVLGGTGLPISHIGNSTLSSNNLTFKLKDVLHCPNASTSIDSVTAKILFWGKSRDGVFPIHSSKAFHGRVALLGVRVSGDVWHSCLGHPSSQVLQSLFPGINCRYLAKPL